MGEDFTETKKYKNDMIEVNDRFVILIDKVNEHELRNTQLEGELKILTLKQNHSRKVETIMGQAKKDLEQQVETLRMDQEKLKTMLSRYNEEEFNNRHKEKEANKAELEQKILKITKDLEEQQVKKVGLMVEKRVLSKNLELLRAGFDEEIKELESQVQNEKKVISDPNKRSLDLEPIIKSVEMKYVEMASRAKEEAEQLNQKKVDALVQTAGQQKQEMLLIQEEITVLVNSINRLRTEKQILQTEENTLRNELEEKGEDGEERTPNEIINLKEQLQKNRENLAEQVLRQQELLNIKLALDLEIATYGMLLENEEESVKNATDV